MIYLVIGIDRQDIDKAVGILVNLEKNKKVFKFDDIMDNLKGKETPPDINDSLILLDYQDLLARASATKRGKTYALDDGTIST